jgi:hypothetical protein
MEVSDDLFTGPVGGPNGFSLVSTQGGNPTRQYGVGPLGRTVYRDEVPLALGNANVAALQASTLNIPLTLAAGAGVTTAFAPDGTGSVVYVFDVPRAVSLTSGANLSAVNYLVTGYDEYGGKMSQLMTGPNVATVNSKKAFKSILSVVPSATSANTVSVGTSDVFGLQLRMIDAGYIVSAKWAAVLAQNAGTFTPADQTSPATNLTGDVRGTYAQSGAASNGVNRLVIAMHVDATQCGPTATLANAIGVPQA